MERWLGGCAAEICSLFHPSGLAIAPYFLKNGVDIRCILFILAFSLRVGCKKWFFDGFIDGLVKQQIWFISGLAMGWSAKFPAGHLYPKRI